MLRNCLGYATPAVVFESELMEIRNRIEQRSKSEMALHREFTYLHTQIRPAECDGFPGGARV